MSIHSNSLILRIRYNDESVDKKFGCDPNKEAMKLLKLAHNLSLNVIGVSFHIGPHCQSNSIYYETIKTCKKVFSGARSYGFKLKFLDIGGGFSVCNVESFETVS
jgi:ornithine decarboxylase